MSWLRNLQGQLTELANEVLSDIAEESGLMDASKKSGTLELLSDVQKQLELLSTQKDNEIATITEQHFLTLQELRENYEEKLRNLAISATINDSPIIVSEEEWRRCSNNLNLKIIELEDHQKSHHSVSDDANEHLKSLELRVAEMALRLEEAEKTSMKYKTEAEVTEKLRQETAEALQSLQGILREISGDHEKESASLQHINEELSLKVSGMTKDIADLKVEINRLKFEKQACEDEVEAVLRDTSKKQRLIDDLENQMEELKSSTQKGNCEYRIDDSTLRSLFLSYFLAANDKKPDIAILLANILQYSKEDIEKISSSFSINSNSNFNGTIVNTGGISFVEQFVRFLEIESESSFSAFQPNESQPPSNLAAQAPLSPFDEL